MGRPLFLGTATLLLTAFIPGVLIGQARAPSDGGMTRSLGQPHTWTWTAGASTGWLFKDGGVDGVAEGSLGVYRDVVNPVLSLLGVQGEGYLGARGAELDGGLRLQVVSPFARVGVGADHNFLDDETHLLLSFAHPIRRGGLFRDGSVVRGTYLPGRGHSFTLGVEVPIRRRIPMGKTRPLRDHVPLAAPRMDPLPPPDPELELEGILDRLEESAGWIHRFTIPFVDHDALERRAANERFLEEIQVLDERLAGEVGSGSGTAAGGRTPEHEVARFHAEFERAFSIAVAGHPLPLDSTTLEGRGAAVRARQILLDEVLLPYNRLLGQVKRPDTVQGFGTRARGIFLRWLYTESEIPEERFDDLLWIFTGVVDVLEGIRDQAHRQWGDSRFVWLPLQYALRPEEHETQSQLDALLERAVGERFSEGNQVSWVVNEQFQFELSRMIHEAEDYHVLWIHDFRGFDRDGHPDEMAYRQVLHSYLAAMIRRVRAYDETGILPVYTIFLDQWFYELRNGRLWMELLEDPLEHRLRLPRGFEAWEDSIARAQDELREAVAGSGLLQAQRRQFGDAWLRNLVRVHVNITNPGDPSFWSRGVIPLVGLPDNMMRDHRKIAFHDLTEADPYRGAAIYTGAGVGEHYASLAWEDRSVLVRGPAALGAKYAARDLLLNQGIPAEEVPYHLQPRPRAPDWDRRIQEVTAADPGTVRALEIHNQTGFNPKQINIAKALLYTLMPPGSVMKVPDSLWNSGFWGAVLLGSALRGGRVLIIAPAVDNAPSSGFAQLGRSQELLHRLILAEELLSAHIESAGGILRVGIFAPEREVTDIPGKFRAAVAALEAHPWLRELYGFDEAVYGAFAALDAALDTIAIPEPDPAEFQYDPWPKLHMKANFLASPEAWEGLMSQGEWAPVMAEYIQSRFAQARRRPAALAGFADHSEPPIDVGGHMVENWLLTLDPASRDRVVFFSVMGSHNQNHRSMVIDGEVTFVTSQWPAVIPYIDLVSVVGQSRWIDDPMELQELLPQYPEWKRRLGRWLKIAL
jgi:hypothetical protein